MKRIRTFGLSELSSSDLCLDAVYEGGRKGNAGDDPLNALLNVSNQGGVRYRGSLEKLHLVVFKSTLDDPDWPDSLVLSTEEADKKKTCVDKTSSSWEFSAT